MLLASSAFAGALVGVDWVPFGRGDVAWVESQSTGTLVGEFDGMLVPALTGFGGWAGAHDAVLGGFGAASVSATSGVGLAGSGVRVGVVRPSVDYRRYLLGRDPGRATAYLQGGVYAAVPFARTWSDSFTEDEQAAQDVLAAETRAQLSGWGLRWGGGAEVTFESGLVLGARSLFVLHRSAQSTEDAWSASTLVRGEAALVLGFSL